MGVFGVFGVGGERERGGPILLLLLYPLYRNQNMGGKNPDRNNCYRLARPYHTLLQDLHLV